MWNSFKSYFMNNVSLLFLETSFQCKVHLLNRVIASYKTSCSKIYLETHCSKIYFISWLTTLFVPKKSVQLLYFPTFYPGCQLFCPGWINIALSWKQRYNQDIKLPISLLDFLFFREGPRFYWTIFWLERMREQYLFSRDKK